MNNLRISLFGKFCVTTQTENELAFESTKVQELFFYLLLHASRPHTREKLAEMLWQDSSAKQSKKYLRQTLWQLQSILDEVPSGQHMLIADSDWIQVNPKAVYWLDARIFEEAYEHSQGVGGPSLNAADAQILMDAVALYKGDLLENWYQDWCLFERERLQNLYLTMLYKLMVYCECSQQYEAGILYGMKMLQCDQAREQTHRQLMRLRFLDGDRTGALRQYQRCVAVLRRELDVAPAQRTREMVRQIERGLLIERRSSHSRFELPETAVLTTPDLLTNLHQLKDALTYTQYQIDHNIDLLQNRDDLK